MSDTENTELEKRLAALEKGSARAPTAALSSRRPIVPPCASIDRLACRLL